MSENTVHRSVRTAMEYVVETIESDLVAAIKNPAFDPTDPTNLAQQIGALVKSTGVQAIDRSFSSYEKAFRVYKKEQAVAPVPKSKSKSK